MIEFVAQHQVSIVFVDNLTQNLSNLSTAIQAIRRTK